MFSRTKKNQRRNNRRPLRTESLETRQLMAGDVCVEFTSGDLRITGNDSANAIQIAEVDGFLEVRGLGTTQINGSNGVFAFPTDAIDDVMIEMGRGNDTVRIENLDLGNPGLPFLSGANASDLNIELGRGDNRLDIDNVFVEGDLRVDATTWRAGDNTINLNDVQSIHDIKVWTGSGDDRVSLVNVTVGDDIRVGTSSGDDFVSVFNATVNDDVSIDSGNGDDTILASATSSEDLYVVGNRGNDQIVLHDLAIQDLVRVDSGRGDDMVFVLDTNADRMALFTGGGEDELQVTDSSTRRLWIDMGSGDDFAELDNLSAVRYSIQGGRGVDVLDLTINDPLVEGRMEGAQRGFESVQ